MASTPAKPTVSEDEDAFADAKSPLLHQFQSLAGLKGATFVLRKLAGFTTGALGTGKRSRIAVDHLKYPRCEMAA